MKKNIGFLAISIASIALSIWFGSPNVPTKVGATPEMENSDIQKVVTSAINSAVITSDNRLFMWGNNQYGQNGSGTSGNQLTPLNIKKSYPLLDGETIVDVAIGQVFSAILTSRGRVFTAGYNVEGQLGDGTTTSSSTPIDITSQFPLMAEENIVQLAAGYNFAGVITSLGRVLMWGDNYFGQLGDGDTSRGKRLIPYDITPLFNLPAGEKIEMLKLGSGHSLALSSANRVFTWGWNTYGQLGDGTSFWNRVTPTDVTAQFGLSVGESFIQLETKGNFTGALTSNHRLFMWGRNEQGQLGDGTQTNINTPKLINTFFELPIGVTIHSIALGAYHASAITSTNQIYMWGNSQYGQLGNHFIGTYYSPNNRTSIFTLNPGESIISLSLGAYHSSALTSESRLFFWGMNAYGQIGNNSTSNIPTPTLINNFTSTRTITFEENGGSAVSDIEEMEGTPITTPASPTKLGYSFEGWFADNELITPYTFSTMPAENITLYAKWVLVDYAIHYYLNGGTNNINNPEIYNIEMSSIQLLNPEKTGHSFVGWYTNESFSEQPVTTIQTTNCVNINLYAKWAVNQYTITFDSQGGSLVSAKTQDYGSTLIAPDQPNKTGYRFDGWYREPQCITAYLFSIMPAENITLYAQWTLNQYTISFDTQGGSSIAPISQNYGTAIVAPDNPVRDGYVFNGWSDPIPAVMPAQNMTISAFWLKISSLKNDNIEVDSTEFVQGLERVLIANKNAELFISIESKNKEEIEANDLHQIESLVTQNQAFSLIDIHAFIRAEGSADVDISELLHSATVTIKIPPLNQNQKNYQIIQMHNGQSETIESVYDSDKQTLSFDISRFSTFAIVYEVVETQGEGMAIWAWLLLILLIPIGFIVISKHDEISRLYREIVRKIKKINP